MKVPEPEEEIPVAWSAVAADTPVHAADGTEVGVAREVLGAEDIFHGLVVVSAAGDQVMIPATDVASITNRQITLRLSPEGVSDLPPYQPEGAYRLEGTVGTDDVSWVEDDRGRGSSST